MTVVRLEAWCDYVTEAEYREEFSRSSLPAHTLEQAWRDFRRGTSCRVQEFASLADGRRLPLGDELGFSGSGDWSFVTLEQLEADVRTTVLPDDDETGDEHPWEWLAERLQAHGVNVAAEQLKQLPYDVVFSRRLLARVLAETLRAAAPGRPTA